MSDYDLLSIHNYYTILIYYYLLSHTCTHTFAGWWIQPLLQLLFSSRWAYTLLSHVSCFQLIIVAFFEVMSYSICQQSSKHLHAKGV